MKILAVEDIEQNRHLLRKVFETGKPRTGTRYYGRAKMVQQ